MEIVCCPRCGHVRIFFENKGTEIMVENTCRKCDIEEIMDRETERVLAKHGIDTSPAPAGHPPVEADSRYLYAESLLKQIFQSGDKRMTDVTLDMLVAVSRKVETTVR